MPALRLFPFWIRAGVLACAISFSLSAAELVNVRDLGLRVARGFRVTLYADDSLGPDVQALTCDPQGNIVIAGPGYVRRLEDRDHDGFADAFVTVAESQSVVRGICYTGQDLLLVGGGALWRYRDRDGTGTIDGEADKLLDLDTNENGARTVRIGPDGAWYLIGGNESGFKSLDASSTGSAIVKPRAGALARLDPDSGDLEFLADGFYSASCFDFDSWGDLIVGDGDLERDNYLPAYDSSRVIDIGLGGFYGTPLLGRAKGWRLPADYVDVGEPMQVLGRSAPSAVLCYRHYQFPPYFRNGLFVADWAFGRIYLLPVEENQGDGYRAPEVFLEPMGVQGLAPTDMTVGPDGSLFVSVGGRGTRGGVYRIDYVADPVMRAAATNWLLTTWTVQQAVLASPQPQAAWSRSYWMRAAQQVGESYFEAVAEDDLALPISRARAIEVLTEVHGGLPTRTVNLASRANAPLVRARVAWSIGRIPCDGFGPVLLRLCRDLHPLVRRYALEAMMEQRGRLNPALLQDGIRANLTHPLMRIRQASARLASLLPPAAWNSRWLAATNADPQTKLTTTLALLWRPNSGRGHGEALETAVGILRSSANLNHRLEAVRMIMMALGDWRLEDPSSELYRGYELAGPAQERTLVAQTIVRAVGTSLPTGNAALNFELARLFAMLEASAPVVSERVVKLLEASKTSDDIFHYLTVLTRLGGSVGTNHLHRIADRLLALGQEYGLAARAPGLNWPLRYHELADTLIKQNPSLPTALLAHPKFVTPDHIPLAHLLGPEWDEPVARLFKKTLDKNPAFAWSPELVDLLSVLPEDELFPLYRQQWNNLALRERLLLALAKRPEAVDADKFAWGLNSLNEEPLRASVRALMRLPATGGALVPAVRFLDRLLRDPDQPLLRAEALALFNYLTHEKIIIQEGNTDAESLQRAYAPVFDTFAQKYPAHARQFQETEGRMIVAWERRLKAIDWSQGDVLRGQAVYRERGCADCHEGWSPLGPDLSLAAPQLTGLELIRSIVFPSRYIGPPYRATMFRTSTGQTYAGLLAHDAPDVVLLRPSPDGTVRITGPDLRTRQESPRSLMPEGLLDKLAPRQIADLAAYLRALRP